MITAIYALVGGIVLFVVSQLAQKLVLDPLQDQTRVIADIAVALVQWARVYANPREHPREQSKEADDACDGLRTFAAKLLAATDSIRCYRAAQCLLRAPAVAGIEQAAHELIFLSNNIYYPPGNVDRERGRHNRDAAAHIRTALGIRVAI